MYNANTQETADHQLRSARVQLACLWSLPVGCLLFFFGLWLSGQLPPLSPSNTAQEIQSFFLENPYKIRIGMILAMLGCIVLALFVAVVSTQMKRVEGQFSPLAYAQLLTGLITYMLGIIPFWLIQVGAFRVDRSPEMLQLLYDMSWLLNIGVVWPPVVGLMIVGACAFLDKEAFVFPRWYAWFSVWIGMLVSVDILVFFFHSGPFAFNGLICFWLAFALFSAWLLATFLILRSAIHRSIESIAREGSSTADSINAVAT